MAQITVPRVTPGLPSELLYQRPDIRQAEAQLASSNFSVEAARAAFFPQIQLTATTGVQSAALASLFGPGAWFYTLAAGLTQPIFDGFLLESQLKQAKGVQLQNLQAYRKAVLSAFADVEKALVALAQFTRQERLQIEAVNNSRKAFDVSETQLRGRHRQPDHRAADPADAADRREHPGAGAADQAVGRQQPVPGARRRLDPGRQAVLAATAAATVKGSAMRGWVFGAAAVLTVTMAGMGMPRRAGAAGANNTPLTFGMNAARGLAGAGRDADLCQGPSRQRDVSRSAQRQRQRAVGSKGRTLSAVPARQA